MAVLPRPARSAEAPNTRVRTAVILAAGEGSRLRRDGDDTPKPLHELLGLTLLERAILRSRAAGVERFVVVTGYEATAIDECLDELAEDLGVAIRAVRNPRWRAGNGMSALAAERFVDPDEPFFLMMCDHIYPATFLDRLAAGDDGSSCLVMVDRDVDRVIDVDEATKVAFKGDRVRRIGKDLERFDAVDTGVFLCRPPLFAALREAVERGNDTLSGGIQCLTESGEAGWVSAGGLFWQDIDTPADLGVAREKLLDSLHGETDGYVTRTMIRHITALLTGRLASRGVRPEVLDAMALASAFSAAALFAVGRGSTDRAAALMVEATAILDPAANEVARLTYRETPRFRMFKSLLHRYEEAAIAAGIGLGASRRARSQWAGILAAATGYVLPSYMRREGQVRFGDTPPDHPLHVAARRDARLLALAAGGLLARPTLGLYLGGLVGHLDAVWSLLERRGAAGPAGTSRERGR